MTFCIWFKCSNREKHFIAERLCIILKKKNVAISSFSNLNGVDEHLLCWASHYITCDVSSFWCADNYKFGACVFYLYAGTQWASTFTHTKPGQIHAFIVLWGLAKQIFSFFFLFFWAIQYFGERTPPIGQQEGCFLMSRIHKYTQLLRSGIRRVICLHRKILKNIRLSRSEYCHQLV